MKVVFWDTKEFARLLTEIQTGERTPAFARIAETLRQQGKTLEATAICERHLPANPDYVSGHLVLARCYQQSGRLEEARLEYEQSLRIDPDNLAALKGLCDILLASGEEKLVQTYYSQIAKIDPLCSFVPPLPTHLLEEEAKGSAPQVEESEEQAVTDKEHPESLAISQVELKTALGSVRSREVSAEHPMIGFEGATPSSPDRAQPRVTIGGAVHLAEELIAATQAPASAELVQTHTTTEGSAQKATIPSATTPISQPPKPQPAIRPIFETQSIADIYAKQGLWELALKVYQKLLAYNPDDQTLQQKVAFAEEKLRSQND